jgi:hypothetical protein
MQRNPTLAIAVAALAVSAQAAIANPSPCRDAPEQILANAGIDRIYNRVESDPAVDCLGGRLAAAVEAALRAIEPRAVERGLPCSARCWLDRPTSAIARVDHDRDPIWPSPPSRVGPDDLVFIVCAPDLDEGWWWIAVGPRRDDGSVSVEVIRE